MKPSVSVIIPTYNVEAYLGAAIDSALAQTRRDIEVIIVDDCSKDRTVEIAERYRERDARVRVFRNERNGGPSLSRNVAIDHARGDWVAVLDSDDWWMENRLEHLLALAEERRADIVCDDLLLVKEGEQRPRATLLHWQARRLGWRGETFELSALKMAVDDYGFLKPMFRKAFLDANGLRYNVASRTGEDFELLLRCLLASARVFVLHEALYFYRARNDSLVADPVRCLAGTLEMADGLIRDLEGRAPGDVLAGLEAFRARKRGEWERARLHSFLRQGEWSKCLGLPLSNPKGLPHYARALAEALLTPVLRAVLSWGLRRGLIRQPTEHIPPTAPQASQAPGTGQSGC
jgi:succinoglycan biosynthesis protein ExoO